MSLRWPIMRSAALANSSLRVVAGSAFLGSIDEEGDTPRAAGDQQLPYTMQIGSGTWDLPAALVFEKSNSSFVGEAMFALWSDGYQ